MSIIRKRKKENAPLSFESNNPNPAAAFSIRVLHPPGQQSKLVGEQVTDVPVQFHLEFQMKTKTTLRSKS
jgi:hypothetical protein